MSDLVLGLDGGGTKTVLALADRKGELVWRAQGAGIGPHESPDWPMRLKTLLGTAEAYRERVGYAAFGMPSFGEIASVSAAQEAAAARLSAAPYCVINDVHAAFEGAFVGRPGVLLLAGTGSMVWAGDAEGRDIRVGGWGHGFGDEGSAFWIGRAAVTAFSHCLDGRATAPAFAEAMAGLLGLPRLHQAEALFAWYHDDPDPRVKVAALARAVDELADRGDETARTLLLEAALHLSRLVQAAWARLPSLPARVWTGAGSIMNSRTVTRHLAALLEADPVAPALPPVGGALWRAATNAGWAPDAAWIDRLRTQLSPQP